MKICGFQKTTLLDYPGHVAATIFLGLCNFRCPFCHNSDLLTGDAEEQFTVDEVLDTLKKRASMLEGVCITGGEPTLSCGLDQLIREIRKLGLKVKLDTNGSRPQVLRAMAAMCGKRHWMCSQGRYSPSPSAKAAPAAQQGWRR